MPVIAGRRVSASQARQLSSSRPKRKFRVLARAGTTSSGERVIVTSGGQVTRRGSGGELIERFQTTEEGQKQFFAEHQKQTLIAEQRASILKGIVKKEQAREAQLKQQAGLTPVQSNLQRGLSPSGGLASQQEQFQTTLRRGAKMETVFEPREQALVDPSELSLYERVDLGLGGYLPGGVSREFAKSIEKKKFTLRDTKVLEGEKSTLISAFKPSKSPQEAELRALLREKVVVGTGAAVTGAALVGGVGPTVASIVGKGIAGVKAVLSAPSTTAALTAILSAGTVVVQEVSKKIGRSERILTPFQQELLGREETREKIEKAIQIGKGAEVTGGKQFFASAEGGPIRKQSQFIGEVREKKFEFAVRSFLQEEGFKGGELEEAVSLAKQQKTAQTMGDLFAIAAAAGGGSEIFGRKAVKYAGITQIPKTRIQQELFNKKIAGILGPAGFAEGFSIDVTLRRSKGQPFDPISSTISGFAGAFSAAGLGGQIVSTSLRSPKKGQALLAGAYGIDPGEVFGDVLGEIAEKATSGVKPSIRLSVPTFTSVFGGTTTTTTSPFTRGRRITPAKTKTASFVTDLMPTIKSKTTLPVKLPTKVGFPVKTTLPLQVTVPTGTAVSFPTTTTSLVPISTAVTQPIPTTLPVPVTSPITTPMPITFPTIIPATTTSTTLSTTISVPVPVITGLPLFIPPFPRGGGGGGLFGRRRKVKRPTRFQPSIIGIVTKTPRKKRKFLTGFEIRGLPAIKEELRF